MHLKISLYVIFFCCYFLEGNLADNNYYNNEDYDDSGLDSSRKSEYVDNRKPMFRNCNGYAPTLKEESPLGTTVIKVEALDPDEHDKIEYSFVTSASERLKFRIDSGTGVITTAHVFDRDEPVREKEVYITVRATDNGRPQLDDVCTFKVLIEDINDSPPEFDKAIYDESMPEDLQVGKYVTRISASDVDDGDNSIIKFEIVREKDADYFKIDENNGVIVLAKSIDKSPGQTYHISVRAFNNFPDSLQTAQTPVKIKVIESNKRPPVFSEVPTKTIELYENFSDYSEVIAFVSAISNVPDKPDLIFELISGRTEQTNSKNTFICDQLGNNASIKLGKSLDYEAITDYTLTISVRNTHGIVAEHIIKIHVLDVNDNIPYFIEVMTGTIPENEEPGTQVMQVRAFDMDGTSPNNLVKFRLDDSSMEHFAIDEDTGNITAKTSFDREELEYYIVKVFATDSAPSSLYKNGLPNVAQQSFRIDIADKNDHPPKFKKDTYLSDNIPEDSNKNTLVIQVAALDNDTASQISYTIVNGNVGDAFRMEETTGEILVNNDLDYENITEYSLRIRAFDGIYEDFAKVTIKIDNVNDNPPKFFENNYNTTIDEETIVEGCILNIKAYDPDIKSIFDDQKIKYSIVKEEQRQMLEIDSNGCLKLKKALDRDLPNGHKKWQVIVSATDDYGNGLKSVIDVTITLNDINDNAPFLDIPQPVVYYENQSPRDIVTLQAKDYDEKQNGEPFVYKISSDATEDIQEKFEIRDDTLYAKVVFDREEQKEYFIFIEISDSGPGQMSNVSVLHLIIGDINDNQMKEGTSSIFVYNYKGEAPNTEIGRIYVDDPDDWDLADKSFYWYDDINTSDYFDLNKDTGMITMREGTPNNDYKLVFEVTESSTLVSFHKVKAVVHVTIREIPEVAVDKSGSIRFAKISAEDFVSPINNGKSYKDKFGIFLSTLFNASLENIDIFTVLKNDNETLDVRFSIHGSPYYEPERINGMISMHYKELEDELGLNVMMINIDECLIEKSKCETSCSNILHKSNVPISVYTNTSSFVGVNAFIQAECVCKPSIHECLNGGTPFDNKCVCTDEFEGPNCEKLSIGFYGDGYALYPPVNPCEKLMISLELTPQFEDGLILYIGPMFYNKLLPIQDFLSLELIQGYPILTVDYGSGTFQIHHNHIQFDVGKTYTIEIFMQNVSVEMTVNNCKLSKCMSLGAPQGPNQYLNVNSPVQLGGTVLNLEELAGKFQWNSFPKSKGFYGCIRNLTINDQTYNLGQPHFMKKVDIGCQQSVAVAVSFGIDSNFLIAIIVCIAVLLILLLAVVVHKRHQDGWLEKDIDDIRETIINYEDEGGGERDTDYDLEVLRSPPIYEDRLYDSKQKNLHEVVPDIATFLTDKKDACDKDMEAYPVDDVRHYAYEGDGNSSGSLSSLASCTDDGDLKFNYLSNFGPRFRKLADMYGEEPSDTDTIDDEDGWRI